MERRRHRRSAPCEVLDEREESRVVRPERIELFENTPVEAGRSVGAQLLTHPCPGRPTLTRRDDLDPERVSVLEVPDAECEGATHGHDAEVNVRRHVHVEALRFSECRYVFRLAQPPVQLDVTKSRVVVASHTRDGVRGIPHDCVPDVRYAPFLMRHERPAAREEVRSARRRSHPRRHEREIALVTTHLTNRGHAKRQVRTGPAGAVAGDGIRRA